MAAQKGAEIPSASLVRLPGALMLDLRTIRMLTAQPTDGRSFRHRRREHYLTAKGFERLLLVLSIVAATVVVGNEVFNTGIPRLAVEEGTQEADPNKPADLRSQLAKAIDQLEAAQNRVGQLEAELTQTRAELDSARKAAENLGSSTASTKNAEQPMSQAAGTSSADRAAEAVAPAVSPKVHKPNVRTQRHKKEAANPDRF